MGNLAVGDADRVGHALGEVAQPRAEHQRDLRAQRGFRANEFSRRFGAGELVERAGLSAHGHLVVFTAETPRPPSRRKVQKILGALCVSAVSPSSLRKQNPHNRGRHQVGHRSGQHGAEAQSGQLAAFVLRQRADAANLYADGAEVGEAAQRKGGDGEARGSSAPLCVPSWNRPPVR